MSDTTNTTENMEQVTEQEKEMQEAQASGVVNFDDKKKDKEEDGSLNYTHTFKKPREIEGKKYTKLTFYFDNLTGEDIEAVEQELADRTNMRFHRKFLLHSSVFLRQKLRGLLLMKSDVFR